MISVFRLPTLKGMAVVCIKVWTFIAKCVSVISRRVIGKHLKTKKRGLGCRCG